MPRVLIVGGGPAGLSTAWYLAQAGIASTLLEREAVLGGIVRTHYQESFEIEEGPDSYLAAKPAMRELVQALGLADRIIGSNDAERATFVVRDGRLVPLPRGLNLMIPQQFGPLLQSSLLSWPTKLKMVAEQWRQPALAPVPERSIGDLVRDHFGQEAVDYLAEPLLAGVYGGDVEELSASSVIPHFVALESKYGSLTRGVQQEKGKERGGSIFEGLRGGWGQLIAVLHDRLHPHVRFVQSAAESAIALPNGRWRVNCGKQAEEADHLVLACPSYAAAELLRPSAPALASLLATIPYRSAATVALAYHQEALSHPLQGFGFLVPKRERRSVLACTWVGTKFPHRVPAGRAMLRCFFSGEHMSASNEELIQFSREEIARLMGVDAEPDFTRVSRWPDSFPQYTLGHQQRVKEIFAAQVQTPGLHLAGNAYSGVGLPDAVRTGKEAAESIIRTAA